MVCVYICICVNEKDSFSDSWIWLDCKGYDPGYMYVLISFEYEELSRENVFICDIQMILSDFFGLFKSLFEFNILPKQVHLPLTLQCWHTTKQVASQIYLHIIILPFLHSFFCK